MLLLSALASSSSLSCASAHLTSLAPNGLGLLLLGPYASPVPLLNSNILLAKAKRLSRPPPAVATAAEAQRAPPPVAASSSSPSSSSGPQTSFKRLPNSPELRSSSPIEELSLASTIQDKDSSSIPSSHSSVVVSLPYPTSAFSTPNKVAAQNNETNSYVTMTSPHLAAPASSGQPSPGISPAHSNATAATFGPGSRAHHHNATSPRSPAHESSGAGQQRRGNFAHRSDGGAVGAIAHPSVLGQNGRQAHIIEGPGGRILCIADVRGNIASLNKLAAETDAQAIIHTGDFGFYEKESFERISDRTLRHLVQYSTLISPGLRGRFLSADVPGGGTSAAAAPPPPTTSCKEMRAQMLSHPDSPLLTEFPSLLSGKLRLNVPVYTVWGACEDVRILEKIRTEEYAIHNLHVLDEASTVALEVGGVRLRLFGLGGAVVLHKLFDNGEGAATIAGGQGTMWTTILQIGELVDTAQKCYDPTETRLLVTHASPGREGLLMQLALALKADLTISAGLHFRYGVSYNEFSVQSETEQFRRKLLQSKATFGEVWDSVREQVERVVDDQQRILLNNGLAVTNRAPNAATATGAVHEEPAWKNTWNWNLPDAAFGHLVLDVREGRVSSEMKSQGFNFAYRRAEAQNVTPPAVGGGGTTAAAVDSVAVAPNPATAAIPTGPARMRQHHDSPAAASGFASRGSTSFPSKSPRQHPRSPAPNEKAGGLESDSRPASSRGSRSDRGGAHRSGDEGGVAPPRGPRQSSAKPTPTESNGQAPKVASSTETINGTTAGEAGAPLPVSTNNAIAKSSNSGSSNAKSPRGHRNRKSGGGASSRSEKSGSESEAKYAGRSAVAPATAPAAKGEAVATSASENKESASGGGGGGTDTDATPGAHRGGGSGSHRGGRGGGRGGRGARSASRGGGSQSQERRKSSAVSGGGGGEQKSSTTGGDAGAAKAGGA